MFTSDGDGLGVGATSSRAAIIARSPANRSSSGSVTGTREAASSYSSVDHCAISSSRGTAKKKPSGSICVACARRAASRWSKYADALDARGDLALGDLARLARVDPVAERRLATGLDDRVVHRAHAHQREAVVVVQLERRPGLAAADVALGVAGGLERLDRDPVAHDVVGVRVAARRVVRRDDVRAELADQLARAGPTPPRAGPARSSPPAAAAAGRPRAGPSRRSRATGAARRAPPRRPPSRARRYSRMPSRPPSTGRVLRVEHVAALAAGARDDEDVDALGRVLRRGRRALARLVVGVGVHRHQAQPLSGHLGPPVGRRRTRCGAGGWVGRETMIAHAAHPRRATARGARDRLARHPTAGRALRPRAHRTVGQARAASASSSPGCSGVALVIWIGLNLAGRPVSWKDVGFHVEGASCHRRDVRGHQAEGVDGDLHGHARCRESYGEVGVRKVEVGPADTATRRVTVTVQTTELAVSGTVERCDLVDEPARQLTDHPNGRQPRDGAHPARRVIRSWRPACYPGRFNAAPVRAPPPVDATARNGGAPLQYPITGRVPGRLRSPGLPTARPRRRGPARPATRKERSDRDRYDCGHLADPGGLRPPHGRARPPRRRGPRRDHRPHRRRTRRGRPQGERRLPRRARGAGQAGGPHPRAQGEAAQRADRHARRTTASSSPAWSSPPSSPATRWSSCSARARSPGTSDIDVFSPTSPLGAAINGRKIGDSTSYTAPNGREIPVEIIDAKPFAG